MATRLEPLGEVNLTRLAIDHGTDGIEAAEYQGLTTVRQFMFESGRRAVQQLLRILADRNSTPVCDVLPTELVVRRTTAPPQARNPRNALRRDGILAWGSDPRPGGTV